jgi:hypothetical protein
VIGSAARLHNMAAIGEQSDWFRTNSELLIWQETNWIGHGFQQHIFVDLLF